jgi:hypothetical protein
LGTTTPDYFLSNIVNRNSFQWAVQPSFYAGLSEPSYSTIFIDETMVHTVIHSLGLIPSQESYSTVNALLETLKSQCSNADCDPVAAGKAKAAFKALLSASSGEEVQSSTPMASEGAPSRNL